MRVYRISWIVLSVFLGFMFATAGVHGGTVFYDDFSDGDPQDADPVTWLPDTGDNSTITADGGDLVITDTGWGRANVLGLDLRDTSIRTRIRLVDGDAVGLMTRWDPDLPEDGTVRNYYGWIAFQGEVGIGLGGPATDLRFVDTDLRPTQEDIMLQLDAIGSQISLWAWRPDEAMPSDPTVTVTNSILTAGDMATYVVSSGGPVQSVLRFVHVADAHIGLSGDMNFDGNVNGLDVDPFVDVLLNGTDDNATRITADMNSDGEVNGLDVDPFVAAVVDGAQQVPEPSTLLLTLLALSVTGALRKWGV
jgi:hypothetical protein